MYDSLESEESMFIGEDAYFSNGKDYFSGTPYTLAKAT